MRRQKTAKLTALFLGLLLGLFCALPGYIPSVQAQEQTQAEEKQAAYDPNHAPLVWDFTDQFSADELAELNRKADKLYEVTGIAVCAAIVPDCANDELLAETQEVFYDKIGIENAYILGVNGTTHTYLFDACGTGGDFLLANDMENYDILCDVYGHSSPFNGGIDLYLEKSYNLMTGWELQDALDFHPVERVLPLVVDEADVLSDSEEASLNALAEEISDRHQMEVAVAFVKNIGDKTAQAFADDYYDYNGYGYGENDDGLMLVVAVESRDYAITTYGTGIDNFDDDALNRIVNVILPKLKNENYAGAAKAFLNKVNNDLIGNQPISPIIILLMTTPLGLWLSGKPMKKHVDDLITVRPEPFVSRKTATLKLTLQENQETSREEKKEILRQTTYYVSDSSDSSRSSSGGTTSTHVSSSGRTHGGVSGKY